MRKFGICMEGCEEALEELVRASVLGSESMFYRYLEIGVGGGHTLAAVTSIVRETVAAHASYKYWQTVGVDLPDGYALSMESIRGFLPDLVIHRGVAEDAEKKQINHGETESTEEEEEEREGIKLEYGRANLVLGDAREVLGSWDVKRDLDLVLIDGCHGRACVMADFEAVSRFVIPGGHVVFHDAGEAEQGNHYQPHCKEGIAVRAALLDLGLMERKPVPNGKCRRAGWRFIREIRGDGARGGHSCVVVRREG